MALSWFQPNIEKLRKRGKARRLIEVMWNEKYQTDAFIALTSLGESALVPIIEYLKDNNPPFDYLNIMAVASIGPPAVEPLLDMLQTGSWTARGKAAQALGIIGDRRAVDPLLKASKNKKTNLHGHALEALARLCGNDAYLMAMEALMDDYQHTQLCGVLSLGVIRNPLAVEPLKTFLELITTPEPENNNLTPGQRYARSYMNGLILGAIESSLAILGEEPAWQQLLNWLHHGSEPAYRASSAKELGRIGGSRAVDNLIKAVNDPVPFVKAAVIEALAQTNEPSAIRMLERLLETSNESDRRWIKLTLHYFKILYSIHVEHYPLKKESVLSLFVFDSDAVSGKISPDYGSYCQSEVLRALAAAVSTRGGWSAFDGGLQGCCGDLLEESMLDEVPSIHVLRSWFVNDKYGISVDKLDPALVVGFSSGSRLGFIPYTIGLSDLTPEISDSIHKFMSSSNRAYKGHISLEGSHNIADLDSELSLQLKLFIDGNHCRGWDVTQKFLNELGLEPE